MVRCLLGLLALLGLFAPLGLPSDDSEDSSDFAFAAPPTTQHSIDIADSGDSAFAVPSDDSEDSSDSAFAAPPTTQPIVATLPLLLKNM